MAFCSKCGTQMADNAAFCPACGNAATQTAAPAPVAAADYGTAAPAPAQAAANTTAAASTPLAENVAGMLAYFTIIPAIIFLIIEPYNRNRFVRFHSFQCLFVAVALVVIDIALMIVSAIFHIVPVVGWFVAALMWPLYSLAILVLWLLLVIKAYQHQIYKLPVVGDMAERQANAA